MEQKYLGITPYDEDANFEFAGRNEETWALYDRIIRNDYTVYYAASGEGKSSLIRAGLLPILRRRNYFPVYIVFEDKEFDNQCSLETILTQRIEQESNKHGVVYEQSEWSKTIFDLEQSECLKEYFWWRLRNYCFKHGETELKPLFIFDQFEEVFTKADYKWTDSLFSQLEMISTDYVPVQIQESTKSWGMTIPTQKNFKAMFSFRTEYLGDLDYWCVEKHFLPALQNNRMCLKPLTPKGAQEVVNIDESSLGKYSEQIIRGCSETKTYPQDEDQPCVYALVLSVVCQTLSEMPDEERCTILGSLCENQDDTINNILLRFYRKKLKEAGLDYIKDEKVIADLEDALVDEKGKRSRRDTDEATMLPLAKWIENLSNKKNGLLKVIGKKEVDGAVVHTVEFPHDRLCKAIDSSRKERQGKIAWKLVRQGEWAQFGVITVIVSLVALFWYYTMEDIAPIVTAVFNNEILSTLHQYFIGNQPKIGGFVITENLTLAFVMGLLLIFIPLLPVFIVRKSKSSVLASSIISFIGGLSFGLLWLRNSGADFSIKYLSTTITIGFVLCLVWFAFSLFKLRMALGKSGKRTLNEKSTLWPLFGGYFLFACYLFYEFLYRTTFGYNEPCDSCWGLLILPILYVTWAYGFFHLTFENNKKKKSLWLYLTASFFLLSGLMVIGLIPANNPIKQSFGLTLSIIIIIIWSVLSGIAVFKTKSDSKYFTLSTTKRLVVLAMGFAVILAVFLLNLGYNPFVINTKDIWHVASWRTVTVHETDSLGNNRLGAVYPTDGEIVIPCCVEKYVNKGNNAGCFLIKRKFSERPFYYKSTKSNNDESMKWNQASTTLSGYIPCMPSLEKYLHRTRNNGIPSTNRLKESIDFYAAKLFKEIRDANVNYMISGESYDVNVLKSLTILDSLQTIAFNKEIEKLSLSAMDTVRLESSEVPYVDALEDKHLVDFCRELSRKMLLCMIKDRAANSDMPAMFSINRLYVYEFFPDIAMSKFNVTYNSNISFVADIDGQYKTFEDSYKYQICSDDILKKHFFAWYNLFCVLCELDINFNSKAYVNNLQNRSEKLSSIYKEVDDIDKKMYNILDSFKTCHTRIDSLLVLNRYKNQLTELKLNNIFSSFNQLFNVEAAFKADESLLHLKNRVMSTLLPILNGHKTGIYNNVFENICRELIIVSAIRCYDVEEDLEKLDEYIRIKNGFLTQTKMVNDKMHERQNVLIEIKPLVNEILNRINKTKQLFEDRHHIFDLLDLLQDKQEEENQ